jgi:hypothetical protein
MPHLFIVVFGGKLIKKRRREEKGEKEWAILQRIEA